MPRLPDLLPVIICLPGQLCRHSRSMAFTKSLSSHVNDAPPQNPRHLQSPSDTLRLGLDDLLLRY